MLHNIIATAAQRMIVKIIWEISSFWIHWLTRVCQVRGSSAKRQKNGKQEWSPQYSRNMIASNAQTTKEYHCLVCQEKYAIAKCREIQTGWSTVRFSSRSQHHGPDLHLKQIFEKSWEYGKDLFACADLEIVSPGSLR